jgi:hypothetical protein
MVYMPGLVKMQWFSLSMKRHTFPGGTVTSVWKMCGWAQILSSPHRRNHFEKQYLQKGHSHIQDYTPHSPLHPLLPSVLTGRMRSNCVVEQILKPVLSIHGFEEPIIHLEYGMGSSVFHGDAAVILAGRGLLEKDNRTNAS